MVDVWVTEFWLDKNLNRSEFERALEAEFPWAEAKRVEVVEDAKPGYWLYHLHTPYDRRRELEPFLAQYAERHSAVNEVEPAGSYPFNPDA